MPRILNLQTNFSLMNQIYHLNNSESVNLRQRRHGKVSRIDRKTVARVFSQNPRFVRSIASSKLSRLIAESMRLGSLIIATEDFIESYGLGS